MHSQLPKPVERALEGARDPTGAGPHGCFRTEHEFLTGDSVTIVYSSSASAPYGVIRIEGDQRTQPPYGRAAAEWQYATVVAASSEMTSHTPQAAGRHISALHWLYVSPVDVFSY